MNFMMVVKGEEGKRSTPLLYTRSTIAWGAPDVSSATQDVIRTSQRHMGVTWSLEGARSRWRIVDRVGHDADPLRTPRADRNSRG